MLKLTPYFIREIAELRGTRETLTKLIPELPYTDFTFFKEEGREEDNEEECEEERGEDNCEVKISFSGNSDDEGSAREVLLEEALKLETIEITMIIQQSRNEIIDWEEVERREEENKSSRGKRRDRKKLKDHGPKEEKRLTS